MDKVDSASRASSKRRADLTAPLSMPRGLPNAAYVDPDMFSLDRNAVLGRTWAAVAFASDLPAPRSVKPVDFMGMPLLLVRDREGDFRVFHNVCSHRGMKLVGEEGRLANVIRCPYHSWTYDFHGNLLRTPLVGGSGRDSCEGFDKGMHGLKEVRFAIWMDTVFINLSGDAPAFERYIEPLETRWSHWLQQGGRDRFRPGGADSRLELDVACNWKLAVENYLESYHLPWVHPGLNSYSPLDRHYNITHGAGIAGQGSRLYNPVVTVGEPMPVMPDWPAAERKRAEYIALYPNTLLGLQSDHFYSLIVCPVHVGRSLEKVRISYVENGADDDRYARTRAAVCDGWKEIFVEDIFAVEGMQAGRQSPGFDGGVLTPVQDAPTHHFHRWVANCYALDSS